MVGSYANGVMIGHGAAEFKFDFLANLVPQPAVSNRVFLAAPQVPRLLESLKKTHEQWQQRVREQQERNQQRLKKKAAKKNRSVRSADAPRDSFGNDSHLATTTSQYEVSSFAPDPAVTETTRQPSLSKRGKIALFSSTRDSSPLSPRTRQRRKR